jgi:hypothetical protein
MLQSLKEEKQAPLSIKISSNLDLCPPQVKLEYKPNTTSVGLSESCYLAQLSFTTASACTCLHLDRWEGIENKLTKYHKTKAM